MTRFLLLSMLVTVPFLPYRAAAQGDSLDVATTRIVGQLQSPVAIVGTDSLLFVAEKTGRMLGIDPRTAETREIGNPEDLFLREEVGIVGMTIDPDFPEKPWLYVHYTYRRDYDGGAWAHLGKVVRYTYDPGPMELGEPFVLLDSITTVLYNLGGAMAVLPDRTLVIGVGDGVNYAAESQSLETLRGKILRVGLDGTIPEDNPYSSMPRPFSAIYSIGHRNAVAAAWDPAAARLYTTDWGTTSLDEINIVGGGENMGWNVVLGACDGHPGIEELEHCDSTTDPFYQYYLTGQKSALPVGILPIDTDRIAPFSGSILVTTLLDGLHLVEPKDDRPQAIGHHRYATDFLGDGENSPVRAIHRTPSGTIYVATYHEPDDEGPRDVIVRIDSAERPPSIEEIEPLELRDVVTDLDIPWEILWGYDNTIWMTERGGRVSRVDPVSGETAHLLTIPSVEEVENTGLLGMALHPNFCDTPSVYLVYTWRAEDGQLFERLVAYNYEVTADTLVDEEVLLDSVPVSGSHAGSRVVIGTDRMLYMTVSDADRQNDVQDYTKQPGKIFRLHLDGSVPASNPYAGADRPTSLIWSIGHRNPQGLVMTDDGRLYSSEHGPSTDDEVNRIERDANYGWPDVSGYCDTPYEVRFCDEEGVTEPMFAWTPTLAPAGLDYYEHDAIPSWKDHLLLAFLKGGRLAVLELDEEQRTVVGQRDRFVFEFGRIRDICVAPDGRVFVTTSNRDPVGTPREGDDRLIEIRSTAGHPALPAPGELCDRQMVSVDTPDTRMFHRVVPLPIRTNAQLDLGREASAGEVVIYDGRGLVVRRRDVSAGDRLHVERGELPSGFYLLEHHADGVATRFRLIVE